MPVYYTFFTINLAGLSDNGYDAARFLNGALNPEFVGEGISFDQLLLMLLIGKTTFFGIPFFTLILFFISALFLHRISVALHIKAYPVWYFIFATPVLIIYLETGKDILIFTAMVFLFGFIRFWRPIYCENSGIVVFFFGTALICLTALCFVIKGPTMLIYYALVFFMAMRVETTSKVILGSVLTLAGFGLGFIVRGPVDLFDVARQTSFSSAHLISDDYIAKAIVSGFNRFFIYFTAPIWYWLVALKNLTDAPGLIFHAYSYLILAYTVLKLKFWRNLTFILAACLFSFCYPFVHLRYFFTFIIFWSVVKPIMDQEHSLRT